MSKSNPICASVFGRAVLVCRLAVLGADNGILAGEVVKLRARVRRRGICVDLIGDDIPARMFGTWNVAENVAVLCPFGQFSVNQIRVLGARWPAGAESCQGRGVVTIADRIRNAGCM